MFTVQWFVCWKKTAYLIEAKGSSRLISFRTEFVGCFFILFQSQKPGGEAGTFTVAELVSKPVSTAVSIG